MRTLSEFASSDLEWVQPAMFRAEWELVAGSERLATLKRPRWYGPQFEGATAEGRWIFRLSFLGSLEVYREGETVAAARATSGAWRGIRTIQMASGRTLRWRRASLWPLAYELGTDDEILLLRLRRRRFFMRYGAAIEIEPRLRQDPELSLITLLGWALMLHSIPHHGH